MFVPRSNHTRCRFPLDFDFTVIAVGYPGRGLGAWVSTPNDGLVKGAVGRLGEQGTLAEAGSRHGPERHMNPVIFQQRCDDAKLVLQRLHPIRNIASTSHPRHVRDGVVTQWLGTSWFQCDQCAPARRWEHLLEIVRGQSLEMNAVDVVPPELEREQPRPGFGSSMQRSHVLSLNLPVVHEYVVKGAVDDWVEPIRELVESRGVRYAEVDRHSSTLRVAWRGRSRRGSCQRQLSPSSATRNGSRDGRARLGSSTWPLNAPYATNCWTMRSVDVPWRQRRQAVHRPLVAV